jgi:hypothetical protein
MRSDERGALGNKSTIRGPIIAIVVVILLVPLITSISYYKVFSPFLLPDPSFALFFLLFAISCMLSYLLLEFEKSLTLQPLVKAAFPVNATIFQFAYFLFGKNRAVQTAIVDLVRRNLLVITKDKLFLVYKERYVQPENEQNPLIQALLKEERTCITYDRIIYLWYNTKLFEHPVLQPIQLLADRKKIFQVSHCLLLLPFVIGFIQFMQCIASGTYTNILYWIIFVLIPACWFLIKYIFCGSLVRWKAKQLVNRQRETYVFYPYSIVSSFAFEGSDAIECYSDGLVLIELFNLGPFIDWVIDGDSEEREYILWSSDGRRGWHGTNNPETIMKNIESETKRRYIF